MFCRERENITLLIWKHCLNIFRFSNKAFKSFLKAFFYYHETTQTYRRANAFTITLRDLLEKGESLLIKSHVLCYLLSPVDHRDGIIN